ncbi:MAG: glycosyltransferase family 39 protein, partial [Polyangiaceae bacterium]
AFAGEPLTSRRPPGYPFFLAVLYRLFGVRPEIVPFAQALLGALAALVVYALGLRLAGSRRVGLVAAAVYAIYPHYVYYAREVLSETLFFALFWSALALLAGARRSAAVSLRELIGAGLLLGLAALVRPVVLLFLPVVPLWALLVYRPRIRVACGAAAVVLVAACAVIAPWTVRNWRVHGQFVPITTMGGTTLLGGNNEVVADDPELYGQWIVPEHRLPGVAARIAGRSEVEADRIERDMAIDFLRENLRRVPELAAKKIARFLNPLPHVGRAERLLMALTYGPVLLLGLLGLVLSARRAWSGEPVVVAHLTVVFFLGVAAVFWGSSRFRLTIEVLLIILAVEVVLRAREHRRAGARARP